MSAARKLGRRFSFVVVLISIGVGLSALSAVGDTPTTRPGGGAFRVEQGAVAPPGSYVAGKSASLADAEPAQLSEPAAAPLIGTSGPVAVPSPDGRFLAYNTWRWAKPIDWKRGLAEQGIGVGDPLGVPTLRIIDLAGDRELASIPGAMSAAWRRDGAVAYERAPAGAYRNATTYERRLEVATSPGGPATHWSSKGRYGVIGWAGDRLLAGHETADGGGELLAFTGPDDSYRLAVNAGTVAISPDGSKVLVSQGGGQTGTPLVLRLLDVADGSEAATLALSDAVDPGTNSPVEWVDVPGDWAGDRVVMTASAGLLVVRATGDGLSVDQVLHLDPHAVGAAGLYEPRFVDSTSNRIVLWGASPEETTPRAFQIDCNRATLQCIRGPDRTEAPRPAYDRSGGNR